MSDIALEARVAALEALLSQIRITPHTFSVGPLTIAWGIPGQPDSITYYTETAPETAASYATVNSPLPPVGTTIILQADIPGVFVFDASAIVEAGDDAASMATKLAAFFNEGAGNQTDVDALKAVEVIAETNGADIAITNPTSGGLVSLLDLSGGVWFSIHNGNATAWDAQTQFNSGIFPKDANGKGIAPPIGSNIGQMSFCAYRTDGSIAKFVTLGFTVVNPDTGEAAIDVYTKDTKQYIGRLSASGMTVNGKEIA